jgi:hypothetical protein
MILADLTVGDTILVAVVNVFFTALFAGVAAPFLIKKVESKTAEQRRQADADAAARRQEADANAAARRQQADADAADRRRQADADSAERRLERENQHSAQLQEESLEYQTRDFLRETYALLLGAQRKSRQSSLSLAREGGAAGHPESLAAAVQAHDSFIELYHRLNLDATKSMWKDARSLRGVLDRMLEVGKVGDVEECERLQEEARHARQNLEGSFRTRLHHELLQQRKDVSGHVSPA